MEFDEHEDLEEEEEEEEEEMGFPVTPVACYDSLGNSGVRSKNGGGIGSEDGGAATAIGGGVKIGPAGTVRYKECQKNHAVSIGGHAVDGCCEFLAAGEEGTLEAVTCAACNCHRNFHRKEIDGEFTPQRSHHPQHHHHQLSPYYHRAALPPPPGFHHHSVTPPISHHRPLALPPAASSRGFSREEDNVSNPSSSGGGGGSGGGSGTKKRFRTKFTQEQKDKMLAFAEKIGWRIQKEEEGAIEQFCAENFIKRHVLKVWMHNNKHTLVSIGPVWDMSL